MEIQFLKSYHLKRIEAFSLPIVLIVILLLLIISSEFFLLQTRTSLITKSRIEKEALNDLVVMGSKILENSLFQTDSLVLKQNILNNPKIYLDTNGDGIEDSLVLYTCINNSSSLIEFVIIGYRLRRSEIGKTAHPLKTISSQINGITRTINILSSIYFTETMMNEYISYSLPEVKVTMVKRLSLVYTK